MRPVLKPALRRFWRDDTTLQLGSDPAHAVVLQGITERVNAVLALLDGTRDTSEVLAAAARDGVPEAEASELLGLLASVYALDDATIAPHGLSPAERERLDPDIAALTLLVPQPGGGPRTLDSRRATHVLVVGAGRVGSLVAALLGAAGIGQVTIRDELVAGAADAVPGGVCPNDAGQPRAVAAVLAAQRAGAASVEGSKQPPNAIDCRNADFAVLALDGWLAPPPLILDTFVGARLPYLLTGVRESYGVVGPLVVPGRTACPRCLDLYRAERDPGWPLIAAQLSTDARGSDPACDVALAAGTAALAAGQALTYLASPGESTCVDATLELRLPQWTVRRRSWRTHADCPCEAGVAAAKRAAAERLAVMDAAVHRTQARPPGQAPDASTSGSGHAAPDLTTAAR